MLSLDIMSSNAGSLSVNNRIWGIQRFMREQTVDILAVQETHLSTAVTNSFTNSENKISLLAANGTTSERGVAIFFNSSIEAEAVPIMPLIDQIPELGEVESGRIQIVKVNKGDIQATLINVYAPNAVHSRRTLFNTLSHIIPLLDEHFILTEDWNYVENTALDRSSGVDYQNDTSVPALRELLTAANAVDMFRETHPNERTFTFKRGVETASRIDRVYIDRLLAPLVHKTEHKVGIGVDHSHGPAVSLTAARKVEKGKETWRINNSALLDSDLYDRILVQNSNVYNLSQRDRTPDQAWINVKTAAKALLRDYGRRVAAKKKA